MDSMKVAVMSDTHGNVKLAIHALKQLGRVDQLIHLGDHYQDALEIGRKTRLPVDAVAGNTDIDSNPSVLREKIIELSETRIFITHGDRYKVKLGLDYLLEKAVTEDVHVVLFGHTHFPMKQRIRKILFLNPGCILSNNGNNSCAFLTWVKGKMEAEIILLSSR